MRFHQALPTGAYDVARYLSETGVWEFGLRRGAGGLRVCANRVGLAEYEVDYAAGPDPLEAGVLFQVVKIVIEAHPEQVLSGWLAGALPQCRVRDQPCEACSHELLRLAALSVQRSRAPSRSLWKERTFS
ncbi:hypothetical protein DAETH_48590 (plasmid) [Deinococcus aetherius]|uniref:Uncharacterized protein n=1 Tax=Deinococcus aetherius TaxID=200252 RepID=A0ABM8AM99_9DEIO|nr:hypothetical protein [Deinococcus aetherius]BDP44890.1 hypothetical protein DAETH_48590 [Deinococcus aetherius]